MLGSRIDSVYVAIYLQVLLHLKKEGLLSF